MTVLKKTCFVLAILGAMVALPAQAGQVSVGGPDIKAMSGALLAIHRTRMEVGMVYYDETLGNYRADGEALAAQLEDALAAVVDGMRSVGDLRADELEAIRLRIDRSLRGGEGAGVGLLALPDYEPALSAEFQTAGREATVLLEKMLREQANVPARDRAAVSLAEVLANYIVITGSPFGTFSYSASTDEADLGLQAAQADTSLSAAELPVASLAKWRFLRDTLSRRDGKGYPWLAYRFGSEILEVLERSE